jgi:hypothetical protein
VKVLAFADLGIEAIYEFEVQDLPVTVAVDTKGDQCAPDWAGGVVAEDCGDSDPAVAWRGCGLVALVTPLPP